MLGASRGKEANWIRITSGPLQLRPYKVKVSTFSTARGLHYQRSVGITWWFTRRSKKEFHAGSWIAPSPHPPLTHLPSRPPLTRLPSCPALVCPPLTRLLVRHPQVRRPPSPALVRLASAQGKGPLPFQVRCLPPLY